MSKAKNSMSFFQKSRTDNSMTLSLSTEKNQFGNISCLEGTNEDNEKNRFNLSQIRRTNTQSVFESSKRPLGTESIFQARGSLQMSMSNLRIINDDKNLPENFDVNKQKSKWQDSKI